MQHRQQIVDNGSFQRGFVRAAEPDPGTARTGGGLALSFRGRHIERLIKEPNKSADLENRQATVV
jgi:hypothetical protein